MSIIRNLLMLCCLLSIIFSLEGQILKPSQWVVSIQLDTTAGSNRGKIIFDFTVDDGWYLYASDFPCEDGPEKAEVEYVPSDDYQLVGGLVSEHPQEKYDEIFDCAVKIFKHRGRMYQKILIANSQIVIEGSYAYQVCAEEDGKCVLGDGDFKVGNVVNATSSKNLVNKPVLEAEDNTLKEKGTALSRRDNIEGPYIDKSILEEGSLLEDQSFLSYLLLAFLLGFASLITPCVFPMIPMTVSLFIKEGKADMQGIKASLMFGLSIVVIYTLAGTVFAYTLGPGGINALATHWAPNLFVFAVFIIFALSFFGLFEINAPSWLVNKADRQAEKGGMFGVFFMALTLVMVSFSCTLPIVGNVMVLSAGGEVFRPALAMFSYSLAIALPFTLFSIFPDWIKKLPKSGGWLNVVKVTLGFIELALCLKFFSIADQAYHWGILDRGTNLVIWIVLFTLLGFYLLGKIIFPNDNVITTVSVPRLLISTAVFSFVLYLITGLFGAPLKALAGYLPPKHTMEFDLTQKISTRQERDNVRCLPPKYADFLSLPHGLDGYFDYKQAISCARALDKPLFIDFTGHGCVNCREMEAVVWSHPAVLRLLQQVYVVAALYVDDKTTLPSTEWYTSVYDGKTKKMLGKQNADLQISRLSNNAQPFYVIVGKDERVLVQPYGYNLDPKEFSKFLSNGTAKYIKIYEMSEDR